jgi:hypothetical protein
VEVTILPKPSMERVALGDSASRQAVTRVNAEQASKCGMWEPTQQRDGEGRSRSVRGAIGSRVRSHRGNGDGMSEQGDRAQHGKPQVAGCVTQPDAREGQAGLLGVSERPIVPVKPVNAGGGKGPRFKVNVQVATAGRLA